MWRKQIEESSYNFRGNSRLNGTPLCPKIERKCKFNVKSNDYWMNMLKN